MGICSKYHVLFVDDEPIVRESYQDILTLNGYHTETACDGKEARKKIEACVPGYDVIITDLIMQDVGGLEVLETARSCHPDAMVILITGYATIESAITAIRKGAYDYLVKPFTTHNLLLTVERAIEKRQLLDQNRRLINDLTTKNTQLEDTLNKLQDAQDMLLKNERKDAFLQTVITLKHEILNPLTALITKLHTLIEHCTGNSGASSRDSLEVMLTMANRISSVLKKLDSIEHPVSKQYVGDVKMIDIETQS